MPGFMLKGVSSTVMQYKSTVDRYASQNKISKYGNLLLAIMMVESGGRGNDVMYSSESIGLAPGTLGPEDSIKYACIALAEKIKLCEKYGCDIRTAIQAYNYGGGFVSYVAEHGKRYTKALAEQFSKEAAIKYFNNYNKYDYYNDVSKACNKTYIWGYGNFHYVQVIEQYIDIDGDNSNAANVAMSGEPVSVQIDYTKLSSYIVTVDRNTVNTNYNALKNIGMVGIMIEAGRLYSSSHTQLNYRNPKLDDQARAASKFNVPFALYSEVRAQSIDEAKKELYELSFCIKKYPPLLGVWLKLFLTKAKSINNSILDTYYNELVKLGLKDRIGLYVTESQLNQIDWTKYQNKWYLWLNRHVKSLDEINQLLTPEFFII